MTRYRRLTAIAISVAAFACARAPDQAQSDTRQTADVPSQIVISQAADTQIIRSPGVPTDPDDTLPTQWQKHQVPRRVATPDCLPAGIALCILDTARAFRSGEVEAGDGGMEGARETAWIVFATGRDSMQLFVPSGSFITMWPRSAGGFGAEHATNDANWIRPRFPHAGVFIFTASVGSDTNVAYQLRVAPVVATGATRPIGASATVTIAGDSSSRVAIAPVSMARTLGEMAFEKFAVRPGSYRVLLVRDTNYIACRLPCVDRHWFSLHPGRAVTVAP